MPDFPLSVETIAQVLTHADEAQRQRVQENLAVCWSLLRGSLKALEIFTTPTVIAALATIRVECPSFHPQTEKYNGDPISYFEEKYGKRADLGNVSAGDGYKFRGRGLVQITGRANYAHYGRAIAVDLVNNPDRALELPIAVDILAAYFAEHGIPALASAGKWEAVRRKVNGGLNSYAEFLDYVNRLEKAVASCPLPVAGEDPAPPNPAPGSSS